MKTGCAGKVVYLAMLLFGICGLVVSQDISVNAAVSARELYIGESFYYQIQIRGTDTPVDPELTHIVDFRIESKSGNANNSQSITIINGRRTETISRGYNFTYALTPKRAGQLEIPSVTVPIGGTDYQTPAIMIQVRVPENRSDYTLEQRLSKDVSYIGEPVTLEVVWAWTEDRGATKLHQFPLPIEAADAYVLLPLRDDRGSGTIRLTVNNGEALFTQGVEKRDAGTFTTLSYKRVLIPKTTGTLRIPQAVVSFDGISGHERRRDLFSGRTVNVETYDKIVISSNTPILWVKELPDAGRPTAFSGLVGTYSISASAVPAEVNVGDPITLRIAVSGSDYLEDVELPDLRNDSQWRQAFKFTADDADGVVEDDAKVFTHTIRATQQNVTTIPPIALSFFDTEKEAYRVVYSESIPIIVRPTRIVTIDDVEGNEPVDVKTELESLDFGIAFNYQGSNLALDRPLGIADLANRPLWLVAWILPLFVFLVPFSLLRLKVIKLKISKDQVSRRSLRLFVSKMKQIKNIENLEEGYGVLLNSIRGYFLAKIGYCAAGVSYDELSAQLRGQGIHAERFACLHGVIDACEAGRYGASKSGEFEQVVSQAMDCIETIDRNLR